MNKLSIFRKRFSSSKGFTLIELLVVIAIIGILSAALFVAVDPAKRINQSKDAKAQNTISESADSLNQWLADPSQGNGIYQTAAQYTAGNDTNGLATVGLKYLPGYGGAASDPDFKGTFGANADSGYVYKSESSACAAGACTGYMMAVYLNNGSTATPTNHWFVYDSANGKTCYTSGAKTSSPTPGNLCP